MAEFLDDGTVDWSMGQDAWHSPNRIQPNQYAAGVNLSIRGGNLNPRPGFVLLEDLSFENRFITTKFGSKRSIESVWTAGKIQAVISYLQGVDEYIISIVCGLLFRTNVKSLKTVLLSSDLKVNQYRSRINWSYAGTKIIVFDYPDYPLIIDGEHVRRADPAKMEVPISVLGTYNNNRLFVANAGVEFTGGDPVGSIAAPNAPITFLEVFTPSSPFFQQILSLPTDESQYEITAMGFIQQLDTNTGIGPLFVSSEKKFCYYRTDQPRDQWGGQGFEGVLLANVGVAGQRAFVNINSDLVFYGSDGQIYALSTSRNESKKWGNVPISREVANYVRSFDSDLNSLSVVSYFNNRILFTANPYRVGCLDRDEQPVSDYAHGGFVVLELENLASFLSEGNPVWTGLWTGVNPVEVATIKDKCFVISKDGECGKFAANRLYQLKENKTYDVVERGRKRNIRSVIYTRRYDFKTEFQPKEEHTVTVDVGNIGGDFSIAVDRKPTHSHEWSRYATWQHKAPVDTDVIPSDEVVNGLATHNFKPLIFGDPDVDGCNYITGDLYASFYEIQYRLIIEGLSWSLVKLKIRAAASPFKEVMDSRQCELLPEMQLAAQCIPDWMPPESSLCQF